MKKTEIVTAWDTVNPDATARKRMLDHILTAGAQSDTVPADNSAIDKEKHSWFTWRFGLLAAACLALIVAVAVPLVGNMRTIELAASTGVKVTYASPPRGGSAAFDLVPRTETELLTGVDIFSGTVTKIDTIKVTFSDWDDYMSLLTVRVEKVLRGNLTVGQETVILVHPSVGQACSICQLSTAMNIGTTALFLGTPTDENSWAKSLDGSEVFYYSDVADYYLSDPVRPLFVQTSSGVAFYTYGWPTLEEQGTPTAENGVSTVPSMQVVEDFILSQI
ncbi:MAG: hypothetical protein LBN10_03470 [Propionibacteriaceae bacterium]|jgi:hypothetical protein|nr:hypothetical protein [Propionibacteriaceae bacterium]